MKEEMRNTFDSAVPTRQNEIPTKAVDPCRVEVCLLPPRIFKRIPKTTGRPNSKHVLLLHRLENGSHKLVNGGLAKLTTVSV